MAKPGSLPVSCRLAGLVVLVRYQSGRTGCGRTSGRYASVPSIFCHVRGTVAHMVSNVVVIALDEIAAFELGVRLRGVRHRPHRRRIPWLRVRSRDTRRWPGQRPDPASPSRRPAAFDVVAPAPISSPSRRIRPTCTAPQPCSTRSRAAHDRGAYVLSVCSGAFVLGEAGLLDGRRCTTHWRYADELARRYPEGRRSPSTRSTSTTTACSRAPARPPASICACTWCGSCTAPASPRRWPDGWSCRRIATVGQAQYVEAPLPRAAADGHAGDSLEPLLSWVVEHLDQPITVDDLAARSHMAPRTFARRFRAEVGATPHDWLTAQRVLLARRLLEETDLAIESVADARGFRRRGHPPAPLRTPPRRDPARISHDVPRTVTVTRTPARYCR